MTTEVAELLRSMPDLEPPADGWQRIAAQQARQASLSRLRRSGRLAAAASVAITITSAIIIGTLYLDRPEFVRAPTVQSTVQPIIVSAPAIRPDVRAADAQVRALQQRSHYMEQVLSGLPRRGQVARADTAGVIAELEDRIAAVDYQLNRVGLNRAGVGRSAWRTPDLAPADGSRYETIESSDLWRRRVEFMDQLVRVRYAETGMDGF